ncbi:hypothetical protein K435DRAFT_874153 [Dendrothele bispora CBS 962.96]|uniref:Uncharacterized protein n=1 Tax=Dendrothele bispora (strain CBS 962.96) TaxID=1314807 RepID=A0A4S8KXF6_DENBC|nr:hypothetical protein K435DRAFT_874153 [Dendrothele bispora CBS 962.96]
MPTPVSPSGNVEQAPSNSSTSQIHDNTSSTPQSSKIVHLPEFSAVLDLMFQDAYLQSQHDLRRVVFDVVAEVVENYRVYLAMGVLSVRMREHIPSHPVASFSTLIIPS